MSADVLIQVDKLTKRFGETTALDEVSLEIGPGERVGIVGPQDPRNPGHIYLSMSIGGTSGEVISLYSRKDGFITRPSSTMISSESA